MEEADSPDQCSLVGFLLKKSRKIDLRIIIILVFMALIEIITETLTTDFAEFLSDRFGLDTNEVSSAVKDYLGNKPDPVAYSPSLEAQKPSPPIKAAKSSIKTCQFLITRGPREGKRCETHIRGSSKFCSKHKVRKSVQKK